jgi:hypothetical protein
MLFLVTPTGRDPTGFAISIHQRAGAAIQFRNHRLDFFQHLAIADTEGELAQPSGFGA